ncbi:hypothetical protein CCR95_23720 [Thiocystis minor]|uniref:DUF6929 family protein n=1 Tax=Thiocystis minor TaxID=61597 RepID=UPI001914B901|nr:hypothetical protein [Thiocystis minor]MBK5966994.1 hypothetical protein [Thiocystis minor]
MLASTPSTFASAQITSVHPVPGTRAGSGLVRDRERLLLVQDDAYRVAWLDPHSRPIQARFVALGQNSGPLPKPQKPDFEAAARLPDGRVLVMGSGSAPTRRSFLLLDPRTDAFAVLDAGPVYDAVAQALGDKINIEGVVPQPAGLLLFNRGNSAGGNAVVRVGVRVEAPSTCEILAVTRWQLGELAGVSRPVPLGFTDAEQGPEGQLWYLAAAEDTSDPIADGQILGSVIGVLGADSGSWTPLLEADGTRSRRKFEGLALDPDGTGGWLVTDADSPDQPAELCRVSVSGLAP